MTCRVRVGAFTWIIHTQKTKSELEIMPWKSGHRVPYLYFHILYWHSICRLYSYMAAIVPSFQLPSQSTCDIVMPICTTRQNIQDSWYLTEKSISMNIYTYMIPGPLFTKRTCREVSKARDSDLDTFTIALKFDRHLGSKAAVMPVKFQSYTIIITSNLATSRLHEIWR